MFGQRHSVIERDPKMKQSPRNTLAYTIYSIFAVSLYHRKCITNIYHTFHTYHTTFKNISNSKNIKLPLIIIFM